MNHVESIEDFPLVFYSQVRDEIQQADLIFISGRSLLSKIIQHYTDSPWSHVGMVFVHYDRIVVFESVEHGVRAIPLSHLVHQNSGEIILARVNAEYDFEQVASSAIDYLGRAYDTRHLFQIAWRITRGRGKAKENDKFICSEYVAKCFSDAGYQFTYDDRGFISPETIWCDQNVSVIGRLV